MVMIELRQALKAYMVVYDADTSLEPGRVDKESAGYREAATPDQLDRGEQCGGCVFFNYDVLDRGQHTCEVVFGPIEFKGVCDLYRPSVARKDPEAPMGHGEDDQGRMVGMSMDKFRKAMKITPRRTTKDDMGMGTFRKMMKQGPPGPPPRPGLNWNPRSHRWVRDPGESWAEKPSQAGKQPGGLSPAKELVRQIAVSLGRRLTVAEVGQHIMHNNPEVVAEATRHLGDRPTMDQLVSYFFGAKKHN